MPMGTPEDSTSPVEASETVDPYSGYKFDPMTGKPIRPEAPSTPVADKQDGEPDENAFTHYVHLADGQVIKAMGGFTHFFESDKSDAKSIPVIGVYPR